MSRFEDQDQLVECACTLGAFTGRWMVEMMFRLMFGAHPDKLISQAEVLELLDISRSSIERHREQGLVQGVRRGRKWFYHQQDIDDYRERLKRKGN